MVGVAAQAFRSVKKLPLPKTKPMDRAQVAKARAMAAHGTPGRVIAVALGYTPAQWRQWLAIGQEEDAYFEEHGAHFQGGQARGAELMDRLKAMEMYQAISQEEAKFADLLHVRMRKAMMKGDMWTARWWLEKRCKEYAAKPDVVSDRAPVKVVFYTPDNGRMPKDKTK